MRHLLNRAIQGLSAAVLVIQLASCDSHSTAGSSHLSESSNATQRSPTAEPSGERSARVLRSVDALAARAGKDYVVERVLPRGYSVRGNDFVILTMTPGGEILGKFVDPAHPLLGEQLALMDVHSGAVEPLVGTMASAGTQITQAAVNKRWIVWKTTSGTDLTLDEWRLFSLDRRDGRVRHIASAPPTSSGAYPAAPDLSQPGLTSSGQVYISVVRETQSQQLRLEVDHLPADGSRPLRPFVHRASGVAAAGSALAWVTGSAGKAVVHLEDGRSKAPFIVFRTSSQCKRFQALAVASRAVAVLQECGDGRQRLLMRTRSGQRAVLRGRDLGYLHVTDDYVAVAPEKASGDYAQLVYDLRSTRLLHIGRGLVGGEMPGGGRYLVWSTYKPTDVVHPTRRIVRLQ